MASMSKGKICYNFSFNKLWTISKTTNKQKLILFELIHANSIKKTTLSFASLLFI